jgi:hypothetical protein
MQGLKGEIYHYVKPALRVGPYFHMLALVQVKLNLNYKSAIMN